MERMQIKLYTILGCKSCLLIRDKLNTMNIDFESIDCDDNLEEAVSVMKLAGTEQLPILKYTLDDEDHFILGYDEENLNKLIKLCKS